jgi:hypothetical protein
MSQNESSLFGTDILGRYFCNTLDEAIESNKAKPFDVVVIGAGMYGAYIASKLYYWSKKQKLQPGDSPDSWVDKEGLKVLILEAGPYITHEHIENLPPNTDIFDGNNKDLTYMKSPYVCHVKRPNEDEQYFSEVTRHNYCVGGNSLAWGKWSPRLNKEALKSWPEEVRDFLNDDNKGYKKVEDETGVSEYSDLIQGNLFWNLWKLLGDKLVSLDHLKLLKPPVAVAASSTVSGLFSPDAFSSLSGLLQNIRIESKAHPEEHSALKSIYLVPNTLAYQLESHHGRVSNIKVARRYSVYNPDTKKFEEKFEDKSFNLSEKCDVILAATAVESTRLVLNSFPRSRFLKENQELIGRNLMAHLFTKMQVRIKRSALGFDKDQIIEPALFHIQGYSENFKKSYHFQLFCAVVDSDPTSSKSADLKTLYKMFYDFQEAVDILQSQDKDWVTLLVLSCSELQGKPDVPLYKEGSNWMDLSPDKPEKFGEVEYRKPYLKWESSPKDEEFWDEVYSTLFDFLSSLIPDHQIQYFIPKDKTDNPEGYWTNDKPAKFDSYQRTQAFWNSRHEAGTMWMGENADTSVTDLDGKLHRVQNVYCADQAIFPTVGSANPVLTGLTLDRKIAQAIIDRYNDAVDIRKDDPDFSGFRPLFNGTSDGWGIQDDGEQLILFNNILELNIKPNGKNGVAWYNKEQFSEFDLIVDWKVFDYFANSGIIIHAPDPAKDREADGHGYEIQIDESGYDYETDIRLNNGKPSYNKEFYGSPSHKTGAIYNLAPANRGNAKNLVFGIASESLAHKMR